jgi:hypothetical protein
MLIKHTSLAWRDTRFALDEINVRLAITHRPHWPVLVAAWSAPALPPAGRWKGRARLTDPIEVAQRHTRDAQRFARTDDHLLGRRINLHDIKRLASSNAEATSLANGVMNDAVVATQDLALHMDDVTWLSQLPDAAWQ